MSKRRFFQMHLSTAVVLTLVAGVLVWANVRERGIRYEFPTGSFTKGYQINPAYGWPFVCAFDVSYYTFTGRQPRYHGVTSEIEWFPYSIVYNSLIALAILLTVWQLCEWRIRRRAVATQ